MIGETYDDYMERQQILYHRTDEENARAEKYQLDRDRCDQVDRLKEVALNIDVYGNRMSNPQHYHYRAELFFKGSIAHRMEIDKKCYDYWTRRFNRILKTLEI